MPWTSGCGIPQNGTRQRKCDKHVFTVQDVQVSAGDIFVARPTDVHALVRQPSVFDLQGANNGTRVDGDVLVNLHASADVSGQRVTGPVDVFVTISQCNNL